MKVTLLTLLALGALFFTACTTPVAIDPMTGEDQTAEYRVGTFYAPLDAPIGEIFRVAIREMDDMGYYRTGELHRDDSISIFARTVGDKKIKVQAAQTKEGGSEIRIRVGRLGDLAESQKIYANIRNAL
ncbi:MAG: DUF3568 family protein [Verrucomicrobia bacterium]|jgi:hypothetical protein|nr:DUF3568 family protein [Verrucomicrobiota bacterium]